VLWYALRRPLGAVKARKLSRTGECREEKDKCMMIAFETSFELRDDVYETVIVRLDKDRVWRVLIYLNNASPY
jgi:hypothetical protein